MKRFIVAAMAVGTFAVAGAARADLIDSVGNAISNLFGVPYNPNPTGTVPGSIHTGPDGRHYQVDAAGRAIPLDRYGSYRDAWGQVVYLGPDRRPMYVVQNGVLVPYNGGSYAMGTPYDRDGDGIGNQYDRYPDDPRYR